MHHRLIFEPLLPPGWLLLWIVLCVTVALWSWRRQRGRILPRRRHLLLALECIAAMLFTLYVSRPTIESSSDDTSAYRVLILVDASESMYQRDDTQDRGTRWSHAAHAAQRLARELGANCELRRFGGNALPFVSWSAEAKTEELSALSGGTAIGASLEYALAQSALPGKLPTGAIVLISDGHCVGENDSAAIDAARRARDSHIPISTLCIGTQELPACIEITPEKRNITLSDGEAGQIAATLHNGFPDAQTITAQLSDGEKVLDSRTIVVAANSDEQLVFTVPSAEKPGDRILTLDAHNATAAAQPQYIRVKDLYPEEKRILYMGMASSWQWRFLRQSAHAIAKLKISAIIRLPIPDDEYNALPADFRPQHRFWSSGLDAPADAWPQNAAALSPFDAVIVECEAAATMPQECQEALTAFVNAGGSILFTGDASQLPDALKTLCPGRKFAHATATGRENMLADSTMLFNDVSLYTMLTQQPMLPRGTQYIRCIEQDLLARSVLATQDGDALLLIRGAGGSGRTAWFGLPESWQWKLSNDAARSTQRYDEFWKCMLEWLSSERIRLLEAIIPTAPCISDAPIVLSARVLKDDFSHAENAKVRACLTAPDGATQFVQLYANADDESAYSATTHLQQPGVWNVKIEATPMPNAPQRSVAGNIIVTHDQRETTETNANPALLADIARISNGATIAEHDAASQINITDDVPKIKSRKYPFEHALTIIALALLLTAIWRKTQ